MKWIKKIIDVKPYKVTCLWNDNQIRECGLKDFIFSKTEKDSYHQLKDKIRFSEVKCDGTTLFWENGIVIKDYDGSEIPGPLDIDPELLFSLSQKKTTVNA